MRYTSSARRASLWAGASFAILSLALACGGSTPPEPEPAPPPAVEPPPAPAEPEPAPPETPSAAPDADAGPPAAPPAPAFKDMNDAQKAEFMKTAVVPKMSELFKGWEPKEFKDGVNCVTCHGPGAKKGEFKMPNAKLPKISDALLKKHPDATKFMSEQVVPEMAKLLGVVPFDPATKVGFGCMACHTAK